MRTDYLVLDLATTGINNAPDFITTDDIEAPSNYVKQEAIDNYIAKERAKRLDRAGLDIDLARITVIGTQINDGDPVIVPCRTEEDECAALAELCHTIKRLTPTLVSYNGLKFDWPLLMRRCLYLGLPMPDINLDRYRTPHVDVWDKLTCRGAVSAHSLTWYCKRFGWTDLVKPLSGAEEAKAAAEGRWEELEASVRHDVLACQRLAQKLGLIPA